MIDLDAKIRSLVERNIPRKDIVSELDAIASDAEKQSQTLRARQEKRRPISGGEREGTQRPIFLHHGVPAQGATDADLQLYDLLKTVQ